MKYLFILLVAVSSVACAQKESVVESVKGDASEMKFFGDKITTAGAISYDELLTQLTKESEIKDVKVKGKVENVCQSKGCWMNIVSDDASQEPMFVQFKDYGFFMPKDIAGETVILQGKAFREETSVDELRHFAEDEGKSKEDIAAITESKIELKFVASGVILK